jgi:hypothetical protein
MRRSSMTSSSGQACTRSRCRTICSALPTREARSPRSAFTAERVAIRATKRTVVESPVGVARNSRQMPARRPCGLRSASACWTSRG